MMKAPKILHGLSRIAWSKISTEFLSVLLAVFLAFLLNEWRQEQDQQKTASIAMQGIVEEIKNNLKFLEYNLPLHDSLYQFMDKQGDEVNQGTLKEEEIVLFKRGVPLNLFALNQNAWSAAQETDAVRLMPFEQVRKLSQIYHIQEAYNDLVKAFFSNVFTNMDYYTGDKGTTLNMTQTLFRNMVHAENSLIQDYTALLEEVGAGLDEK